jgi:uncharacterized phage protein gp47/JayE
MPDTAQGVNLDRWAKIFDLTRHKASKACGTLLISSQSVENMHSPISLVSSTGQEYTATQQEGRFLCESLAVGVNQNLSSTDLLFPKDINSKLLFKIVDRGISGGNDVETDDELRERILFRIMHPSRGGTKSDYIQWVKNCPGFVAGNVWVYPSYLSPGNVGVTLMTKSYKTPFPTEAELERVRKELTTQIPVGTSVTVYPLVQKEIDFKITLNNPKNLDLIQDAIQRLLFESALPETTLTLSKMNYTLSNALKGDGYTLVSPTQDIQFAIGECGVMKGGFHVI